ncbi:MAG: M48 family metallopeptidase [Candidatus Gastranaerophilales bacterium]|nr:M48 family metallopeptidase [Candidatus Gastranaerophilales bacterium]MCM1072594.1 M48 family metallopeptidase [Bacteroides sp.]
MKKVLVFIAVCLLFNTSAYAKDYAKIQLKELEKAQKYNTTDKYYADYSKSLSNIPSVEIKDPKLIKLSGYEFVSADNLKAKAAEDNLKYMKIKSSLYGKKADNYNAQAYGDDFYKIYRIAERIIRANNLDYINWRIVLQKDTDFNAYSSQMNCITINTGAYDTFSSNDDALALLIGHEMAHSLLGHYARTAQHIKRLNRCDNKETPLAYLIAKRRYLSDSKKMEYAADTTGAILVARASYNLSNAKDLISFLNTIDDGSEFGNSHPNAKHRLENFEDSRKYFLESEWKKQGIYNAYKSDVLMPKLSSDRKSIVIPKSTGKTADNSYKKEMISDFLTRHAYKSYINGEFKNAEKYFGKLLDLDKNNPVAFLYFSYTEECLYKQTGNEKYLQNAKAFANYAQRLAPNDKHIKEQIEAL